MSPPKLMPAGLVAADPSGAQGRSRHAEVECLADALPFLIARDDERPSVWLSAAFGRDVEDERRHLALVSAPQELAARYRSHGSGPPEVRTFETAARRLGRDAPSVAIAIRWLELRASTRLPIWHDLLRRPATATSALDLQVEAAIWFG